MLTKILDNLKTLIIALIIAILIRSLFFQPFYIPSSSMEPTLLVGDRIFVSKYTYGYSKHSFPFSPSIIKNRLFYTKPNYGDLVVFKTPSDNRTDFIKRLIGFPGDKIQFIDGNLLVNNEIILKIKKIERNDIRCAGKKIKTVEYSEELNSNKNYSVVYRTQGSMANTDVYKVPKEHFFFLGDNRDCSSDSRFLSNVGYVHQNNLVGKARIIFFSNDTQIGSVIKFWNWGKSLRTERFFKVIK
tara:strand:- start:356 stop:1084 length:729 start_codon:yes stop_codon:yes gene_type:complete